MPCQVRPATLDDLDQILSGLKSFSNEYESKKSLYGPDEYVSNTVAGFIENHIFLVAVKNEEIIGFVAGMLLPHLYNPELTTLVEMFWYVKPEHRTSRAAFKLIKEYTEFGRDVVDWTIFSIDEHTKIKEENMIKLGYRLKEKSYLLEGNHGRSSDTNHISSSNFC